MGFRLPCLSAEPVGFSPRERRLIVTHSAPFPDLWPSRQAVKNILGTGEKLLAAINQYRANPSALAPRNAVYHETKRLEKLLNPRGLSSDDPERNHFDSKGWPIELIKGFSKISFSVDAILHVCNWESNRTPFGGSPPTGSADTHGSLFSGVTVIVPLNLKSISDNHVSKLEKGLELLQKALASVEHLPPTADEWVESTKGEGTGGKASEDDSAQSTPGKPTVNARMLDLINKKPECHTWSAQKFAGVLGCNKSTVSETSAWKTLMTARELKRQERAKMKQEIWQKKGR
jgi:hypothetical protein